MSSRIARYHAHDALLHIIKRPAPISTPPSEMEAPKNCPAVQGQLGLVDDVVHKDEHDGDPREKTSKITTETTKSERSERW